MPSLPTAIEDLLIGRTLPPPRAALQNWRPDSDDPLEDNCPRCASSTGPFEADFDGCPRCRDRKLRWDRAVRLGPYEGPLREQILNLKYRRWRPAGRHLGKLLGELLARRVKAENIEPAHCILVPAPTSWRRTTARGLDHADVLARAAASAMSARIVGALTRRHRPPQAAVSASHRRSNVNRSMACARPHRLSGAQAVILIDDVRTTGATMTEAWRALAEAGVRPPEGHGSAPFRWVASVAVTDLDR